MGSNELTLFTQITKTNQKWIIDLNVVGQSIKFLFLCLFFSKHKIFRRKYRSKIPAT